MSMGDNIRALRESRGISQQELASALSRTQQAVDLWERNKSKPTAEVIEKMANYFNATPNEIYGVAVSSGNARKNEAMHYEKLDSSYFKIMEDAKKNGISAKDLSLALDFLKRARERNDSIDS